MQCEKTKQLSWEMATIFIRWKKLWKNDLDAYLPLLVHEIYNKGLYSENRLYPDYWKDLLNKAEQFITTLWWTTPLGSLYEQPGPYYYHVVVF